jgi:streptogramin lyase
VAGPGSRIKESLNSRSSVMGFPFDCYCTGHRHASNQCAWRHISRWVLYSVQRLLFTNHAYSIANAPKLERLVFLKAAGRERPVRVGSLWVPLCGAIPLLAKVDLKSNQLMSIFKTGPAAAEGGVAASPDSVWLVIDKQGSLARIDPDTGTVRQITHLPAGSYNPFYSDGQIWVTRAAGTIPRIELEDAMRH